MGGGAGITFAFELAGGQCRFTSRRGIFVPVGPAPEVLKFSAFGQDKTAYCRALGYRGRRRVIVLDGRVPSHGNADWFEFCESLHA